MWKSIIFLMKSFLGIFYRHLATFYWSHLASNYYSEFSLKELLTRENILQIFTTGGGGIGILEVMSKAMRNDFHQMWKLVRSSHKRQIVFIHSIGQLICLHGMWKDCGDIFQEKTVFLRWENVNKFIRGWHKITVVAVSCTVQNYLYFLEIFISTF